MHKTDIMPSVEKTNPGSGGSAGLTLYAVLYLMPYANITVIKMLSASLNKAFLLSLSKSAFMNVYYATLGVMDGLGKIT